MLCIVNSSELKLGVLETIMEKNIYRWEILNKLETQKSKIKTDEIIKVLLKNRAIKTKKETEEFFNPTSPKKVTVKSLGIDEEEVLETVRRIKKAISAKEEVIIYGDYDTDGVCATAILWETLYSLTKKVKPYIPSRFEEGYGINPVSISKLKVQNPELKLIITVDNGVIANEAVDKANELGVDVIITDHHQKADKLPRAYSIIHTDKISGSGIAWILAREMVRSMPEAKVEKTENSLELAAIGTIADQLPLIGPNRCLAKYGLEALNRTKRVGLKALFEEASIKFGNVGTYEVNYVIAPRINAMGRLEHAIDSLRLLCTTNSQKARDLANYLGRTNVRRRKVVEDVMLHAREMADKKEWKGAIVLAHKSYHEGVIGLAASKLVEEFYRPAIVISKGGKNSKASARSIHGFNIIENIRKLNSLIVGGGGHPMAAGFTIETSKIGEFAEKFERISSPLLTPEVLTKKLKVDMEVGFENLNLELMDAILKFEPSGVGNPTPAFMTFGVNVKDARRVGTEEKHLKLTLEKEDKVFAAIAFGKGGVYSKLLPNKKVDVVFNLFTDTWNGSTSLQLKIKDLKVN